MKVPIVSIIIPLYNKELIVGRTIQSVLRQSFSDIEIVIINDGSTDGSVAVVDSFYDDRIHLISQENGGPSKARNTGVKHSHGSWILFLDADDELAEDALLHLYSLTQKFPDSNIIDGSFVVRDNNKENYVIYEDGKCIKNNYKAFFYKETLPSTGHTLFKKEILIKFPYNTAIRRYEDVEMIMRIMKEARIVTTSKPIFYVNIAYSNASSPRRFLKEDFLGHLDFSNKSFWEYMCLYQFYLGERDNYTHEVDRLYPHLRYRYDLLLLYKLLHFYNIIKKNVFQRMH